MPLNISASISTITVSTRRALRHSTGRKAATLSLIASIPVRAAQPELNARISSRGVRAARSPPWAASSCPCCTAALSGSSWPVSVRSPPATNSVTTMAIKR